MAPSSLIGSMSPSAPRHPQLALAEGHLLGSRYRVESLVRSRSAGIQFVATDLTNGARVSTQVLVAPRSNERGASSMRSLFLSNARRATALASPHVARIFDAGVTPEGHPWIVREHFDGKTLDVHLREYGAMDTQEAVDVALAVCDAMAEAHAHDLLHLSLGPHVVHVMRSESGLMETKVVGIGTSAIETALTLGRSADVDGILRAPEQLRHGSEVDARADLWAIGALLHTMLAGTPPFSADAPSGASLSVILDDPPLLAGVPDELAEIVERLLAKAPEQRPESALEVAELLAVFASNPGVARTRIARRRRPLASTLIVERPAYEVLAREQAVARARKPVRSSTEIPVDVTPTIPAPKIALPKASAIASLEPTARIVRAFPRRQALKILALVSAAACITLLVLIGTAAARLKQDAASSASPSESTGKSPPLSR